MFSSVWGTAAATVGATVGALLFLGNRPGDDILTGKKRSKGMFQGLGRDDQPIPTVPRKLTREDQANKPSGEQNENNLLKRKWIDAESEKLRYLDQLTASRECVEEAGAMITELQSRIVRLEAAAQDVTAQAAAQPKSKLFEQNICQECADRHTTRTCLHSDCPLCDVCVCQCDAAAAEDVANADAKAAADDADAAKQAIKEADDVANAAAVKIHDLTTQLDILRAEIEQLRADTTVDEKVAAPNAKACKRQPPQYKIYVYGHNNRRHGKPQDCNKCQELNTQRGLDNKTLHPHEQVVSCIKCQVRILNSKWSTHQNDCYGQKECSQPGVPPTVDTTRYRVVTFDHSHLDHGPPKDCEMCQRINEQNHTDPNSLQQHVQVLSCLKCPKYITNEEQTTHNCVFETDDTQKTADDVEQVKTEPIPFFQAID